MPNWCANTVTVYSNSKEENDKLVSLFEGETPFNSLIPTPEGSSGDMISFRTEHWGTKWEPEMESVYDDYAVYEASVLNFETAWAPPIGIYQKLTELGYKVYAAYIEPGMDFCGTYSSEEGDQYVEGYSAIVRDMPREEWPSVVQDVGETFPL